MHKPQRTIAQILTDHC